MISTLDLLAEARAQAAGESARDPSTRAVAYLHEVSADGVTAVVSLYGSQPIRLPCAPGVYTDVTTCHVLMEKGRPVYVLAPGEYVDPYAEQEAEVPPPVLRDDTGTIVDAPEPDRTVRGKVITPTWSGTYRSNVGAWDRWNIDRYGGRSDLYQGSYAFSGAMTSLATYGAQVKNLGAKTIGRARLTLVSNGAGAGPSWAALIQGSAAGSKPSGAPAYVGEQVTKSGVPGWNKAGQKVTVDLPATVREALRVGDVRALGLVGTQYGGVYGTSHGAGMALSLDYTVSG